MVKKKKKKCPEQRKKSVWQNLPVFLEGDGEVIPGDRPLFFFFFLAKLGLCLGLQTSQVLA